MNNVRLVDVAAHAGVSMKTVSNVVHAYPHIRPATRAKVQAAIDELGYRPHSAARRLATGRTGMLSLAIPVLDIPYFAELARCLADEAARRDYRVLIQQTIAGEKAERAALDVSEAGLVDGILAHPVSLSADEIEQAVARQPIVLLGEGDVPSRFDRVMIDNVKAAREAVDLLVRLGRRRIAFLGVERAPLTPPTVDRIAGYRQGLEEAGLEIDDDLLIPLDGFGSGDALRAIERTLAAGTRFDGIVCRHDGVALGALRALRAAKVRVPDDVALVGWDDDTAGEFLETSLTTVRPDKQMIATTAIDLLIERIEGYDGPGRHVIVPHTIEIRESAPLPASDRGFRDS
ncbi:LacI family transcriptional regulator [Frondihabitans sucicola]|uniref:LacI family transcriptional regulator n=1 Tax=Frondihabitans sucicola TaxID=1268041 RepID=A0ABN6XX53_9MICO|nr:LacI family DNA-binding transcriptional regulator [Frondihabitans sucicola]BDZ48512.1 LacI family transcriptional regulator [Frondihabitans sucicola]